MRIALDLSPLAPDRDGAFTFGIQKVAAAALSALERRTDVELLRVMPPAGVSLGLWRQRGLGSRVREDSRRSMRPVHLIHSWTSAFPLMESLPVTQTVHEAPWARGARENAGPRHRLWARLGRARAALVFTPSAGAARDLGSHERLRVVPWGVGGEFSADPEPSAEARLGAAHPGLFDEPYVLVLGGTRPKKQLHLLLAGARRAKSGGSVGRRVVCTGPRTEYADRLAAQEPGLRLVGPVEEALVPSLVRGADSVAILSRSEGFALPALEALAAGTPVLVTASSVQAETAGGFGLEVDPRDPDAVGAALETAQSWHRAEGRRERGMCFAKALTWDRTAAALVDAWRSVL